MSGKPAEAGPVRPFVVDPVVMSRIRRMTARDVPAVAGLHREDMGNSLWAQLGRVFLETLYGGLVESRFFLAWVYEEDGCVGGFIAGSTSTSRLFRDVLRRRFWRLAWAAFLGLLKRPALLMPLLATPFYFRRSAPADDVGAESMFCSFVPELRGRRVSGHVNKILFDELARRGHSFVKVTTEAGNAPAIRQLTSWGFEQVGDFRFYGKAMRVYVLDLRASPRMR